MGINLIKRLTSSNPSPNYVDAVATAFKTGAYGGVTYGGSYADLGATVAAILLHPEARASVLEMDTGHGKLAEPIVQFMGLMRSMQYESPQELEVDLYRQNNMMLSAFGQEPYNSPSVFNFYKPEYAEITGRLSISARLAHDGGQFLLTFRVGTSRRALSRRRGSPRPRPLCCRCRSSSPPPTPTSPSSGTVSPLVTVPTAGTFREQLASGEVHS